MLHHPPPAAAGVHFALASACLKLAETALNDAYVEAADCPNEISEGQALDCYQLVAYRAACGLFEHILAPGHPRKGVCPEMMIAIRDQVFRSAGLARAAEALEFCYVALGDGIDALDEIDDQAGQAWFEPATALQELVAMIRSAIADSIVQHKPDHFGQHFFGPN